uniref:AraC family transcriptional regulator n=1 Tax=Pedobacter schmidteae TaxID=2201271 RepID=UPI000EB1E57D|nr:AraC family transcriptional regulator [Pedobacter schmidteae]
MKATLIEIAPSQSSSIAIKMIKQNHFTTPFHFHDYCELNYVKKSFGKRVVGDSINNFFEGDLVLMSPNLPHVWYNDPEILKDPSISCAEAIVTYFPIDFLDKLTNDNIVLSKTQHLFEKAKRGLRFYGETKRKVVNHLEAMANIETLPLLIKFLEIINILLSSKEYEPLANLGYNHSYKEKDAERMNGVYKYLMMNFANPISLAEIASIANMTPPAFCSFFKKRTEKCFTDFLNELRIGHACKLLQNQKLSISEVCFESGYQNFTTFNMSFKKITGKTPSDYRKEYLLSANQY